jgi:hypothetical protein
MRYRPHSHEILAHHRPDPRQRLLWGIALVTLGTVFLLDRLAALGLTQHLAPLTRWWHVLPLLFALGGAISVLCAQSVRHVLKGLFKIVLGVWVFACLEQLWTLTFSNSWPILLIAFGLQMAVCGWLGSARDHCKGVAP